ncbi:GTP-binding protein [Megasphaera sp. NM10]|uniref:GTP-binding protein n=1 Tax=Megasphaera sp. NM10 TaxID=1273103 RepID=UPI0008FBD075|nr:GTP-binding protein [Megasphaera sp. NM10]
MDRNGNGLLKFITCGSVDDGKSTLIGHLLYDAKLLYADQKKALELESKVGSRGGAIDYSLLLDGLMAEREQGITIDVAYRYFSTDNRSFIVADTPGHEEYTRNMAVGASFADLAIILIDATKGVLVQTRRHARICALMGIRYFIFAINKMDLAGYSQERFEEIKVQIAKLRDELELANVILIPVSATEGDNVTKASANMPGTRGRPSSTIWKRSTSKKTKKKAFTCPSSASAARTTPSAASRARSKAAPWPSAIRLRPCPARKKLRSNPSSSASIPSIRPSKASRSTSSSTAKSTYPGAASLPRGRTSP